MKQIAAIISIILLVIGGYLFFYKSNNEDMKIINIDPKDKSDLIVVASPIKNSEISSPLRISGRARGMWYFEGSFPIALVDQYGNTIAESYVTAQGEWMTEEFVPFLGTLQFNNYIKGTPGTLIVKKANASGLPEHDDSLEIPVVFK